MATCVRQAWLDLYGDGSTTIQLENGAAGYFCGSLDLGYPTVRTVSSNRPDQNGEDDRTQYMGGRVVTANITAVTGAGARIDAVASSFGPYMDPSARPVLHYILDRPGTAERTLVVRGSGYAWPIVGPDQRDIQLQWVAADPVVRDTVTQTVTASAGVSGGAGRVYPLTFNRSYPAGGSAAGTTGTIVSHGDIKVRPLVRIYGPISGPGMYVHFAPSVGPTADLRFVSSFRVDAGHWVDVDTRTKTALMDSDPTQSVLASLDWLNTTWPALPVAPASTTMNLYGAGTSNVTQAQSIWQDGFLT
jgi:hypothetical protein